MLQNNTYTMIQTYTHKRGKRQTREAHARSHAPTLYEEFHNLHELLPVIDIPITYDYINSMPFNAIQRRQQQGAGHTLPQVDLSNNNNNNNAAQLEQPRNPYTEAREMGQMNAGANMRGARYTVPFDSAPVELELREEEQIDEDDEAEDVLPALAEYNKQKKKLEDWEEDWNRTRDAGVKEQTLPSYVKKAQEEEDAEENGDTPGVVRSSLPGSFQASEGAKV